MSNCWLVNACKSNGWWRWEWTGAHFLYACTCRADWLLCMESPMRSNRSGSFTKDNSWILGGQNKHFISINLYPYHFFRFLLYLFAQKRLDIWKWWDVLICLNHMVRRNRTWLAGHLHLSSHWLKQKEGSCCCCSSQGRGMMKNQIFVNPKIKQQFWNEIIWAINFNINWEF